MITGLRSNGTEKDKFDWLRVVATYKLSSATAAVAMIMFSNANMDGTRIWGSQRNLAALINRSLSSVKRAHAELMDIGVIEQKRRGAGRSGMSSNFELVIPVGAEGIEVNTDTYSDDDENNRGQSCTEKVSKLNGIGVKTDPPIYPIINPTINPSSEPSEDGSNGQPLERLPDDYLSSNDKPDPLIGVKTDTYSFTPTTDGSSHNGDRYVSIDPEDKPLDELSASLGNPLYWDDPIVESTQPGDPYVTKKKVS